MLKVWHSISKGPNTNIYNMKNEREQKILITYVNEHGVQVTAKVTQANLDRLALKYEVYLIK